MHFVWDRSLDGDDGDGRFLGDQSRLSVLTDGAGRSTGAGVGEATTGGAGFGIGGTTMFSTGFGAGADSGTTGAGATGGATTGAASAFTPSDAGGAEAATLPDPE